MKLKVKSFLICTLLLMNCNNDTGTSELEKHFTKAQIEDLNALRLFYINKVLEIEPSEFHTQYLKAFDEKSAYSFPSASEQIIDSMLATISESTFNEIWERQDGKKQVKDTTYIYEVINPKHLGKYQSFLKSIADTNKAVEDYYSQMIMFGGFPNKWMYSYIDEYPKEFNLENLNIQILIAIHHISTLKEFKSAGKFED